MAKHHRPTQAAIYLHHIGHNYTHVQQTIAPKTVIPVLKANAYGHGSVPVARYLYRLGVRLFAVSLMEEALELKDALPDIDVLVMGLTGPKDFETAVNRDVIITVFDESVAEELLKRTHSIRFHLKVDTGMNRLGFKHDEDVIAFMQRVKAESNLRMEGIYTHFATADSNPEYYRYQQERFALLLKKIPFTPPMVHASNSSSAIKYEQAMPYTTHARVGILLYGLTLDKGLDFLKPAMRLTTRVMHLKQLQKGERISYNITYEATTDERIAVLPIGYADGLIRKNQGGDVSIHGKRYPIVGRVCMDQTLIRVDEDVKLNDCVHIMGDNPIHIDEVAERLDTINYEVVTQVGARVPRVYYDKEVTP